MARVLSLLDLLRDKQLGGVRLGMTPAQVRPAWGGLELARHASTRARPGRFTQLVGFRVGHVGLSFDDRVHRLRHLTIDLAAAPEEQAAFLRAAQFDAIDAWLFARPLAHSALVAALRAAGIAEVQWTPRFHAAELDHRERVELQVPFGRTGRLALELENSPMGVPMIAMVDRQIRVDDFTTEGPPDHDDEFA